MNIVEYVIVGLSLVEDRKYYAHNINRYTVN